MDVSTLTPSSEIKGDSEEDTNLLRQMFQKAEAFLKSFAWCSDVKDSYFGLGAGGVVAVFLFHIAPAHDGVDDWLWVVVGDLPPAYLVTDESPSAVSALRAYIREMRQWTNAARLGRSVDGLIPVDAEPTLENAERLSKRLDFLGSIQF